MIKNIPLYCQECHNVDIFSDFSSFFLFIQRKWDLIWQSMDIETRKKIGQSRIVGRLTIEQVTPKQLRKFLEKNQYVTYACRDCHAFHSETWYKANGYPNATRYGRVIADKDYADKHKEEIYALHRLMNR